MSSRTSLARSCRCPHLGASRSELLLPPLSPLLPNPLPAARHPSPRTLRSSPVPLWMDGLDALLAEATAEREEKQRAAAKPARSMAIRPLPQPLPPEGAPQASSEARVFYASLKSYIERLIDPDVLDGIEADLRSRTFAELEAYVHDKPDLARYTLETELDRMEYTVLSERASAPLTEPSAIREEYSRHEPSTSPAEVEMLWRVANQSLLAEPIASLQAAWLEPSLHTCVVATSSTFRLDLRPAAPHLVAKCDLAVQTLGAGDAPLLLATTCVTVHVSPTERLIKQMLAKPRLADCCIYEEQIVATAEAMASWEHSVACIGGGAEHHTRCPSVQEGSLAELTTQLERFLSVTEEQRGESVSLNEHSSGRGGAGLLSGFNSVTSGLYNVLAGGKGTETS